MKIELINISKYDKYHSNSDCEKIYLQYLNFKFRDMAKRMTTLIRIEPEIKYLSEQIAASDNRSLSNFIEKLLSDEIESRRKTGFNFMRFNEASTEYVGRGTDEKLVEEFEKLTKKGK